MKKFKTIILCVCVAALLLALSGCAMTPEKMVEKIKETYAERVLSGFDITLAMDMSMSADGETESLSGEFEGSVQYAADSDGIAGDMYMEMDYTVTTGDQKLRDGLQMYIEMDEDMQSAFVHMDSMDLWVRSDSEMPIPENSEPFAVVEPDWSSLTLAEETTQINGIEVYVASGSISGADIQAMLDEQLADMQDELNATMAEAGVEDFDWSALDYTPVEMPYTFYVDTETFEIVQVDFEVNNLGDVVNKLFEAIFSLLPEDADIGDGVSMEVKELSFTMSNLQFDGTEVPKVSEEGRMLATQNSFNPDMGDGSYVIQESGDAVRITAAEDWTVTDMGYWYVYFVNANDTLAVNAEMVTDIAPDEVISLLELNVLPQLKATDYYRTSKVGPDVGEYSTYYVNFGGMHMYYAWKPVGDGLLLMTVIDARNANANTALTPIFDRIETYQLEY